MQASPAFKGYKIGAVVVGILLAVVVSGVSVSEGGSQASDKQADALHQVARGVTPKARTTVKQKTVIAKPVLVADAGTTTSLLAVADNPAFTQTHRTLSDKVLRALPFHCRTYLKNYYIVYQNATHRGLGGKTTIILDGSVGDAEFAGLLTHECAHVMHGNLSGTPASGASAFKDGQQIFYADSPMAAFFSISWMNESVTKAGIKSEDFVSGYARSNAFEDFAETFAMYVLQRDAFRLRAQTNDVIAAKLAWMELYVPMAEDVLGEGTYVPEAKVPWDVTRLPFVMK